MHRPVDDEAGVDARRSSQKGCSSARPPRSKNLTRRSILERLCASQSEAHKQDPAGDAQQAVDEASPQTVPAFSTQQCFLGPIWPGWQIPSEYQRANSW